MSEQAKHTPGPWFVRPRKHDDWGWVRDANGELVACARAGQYLDEAAEDTHRRNKTDPYGANATLIAAAPELLTALRSLAEDQATARWQNAPYDLLRQARTAIAKATGAANG